MDLALPARAWHRLVVFKSTSKFPIGYERFWNDAQWQLLAPSSSDLKTSTLQILTSHHSIESEEIKLHFSWSGSNLITELPYTRGNFSAIQRQIGPHVCGPNRFPYNPVSSHDWSRSVSSLLMYSAKQCRTTNLEDSQMNSRSKHSTVNLVRSSTQTYTRRWWRTSIPFKSSNTFLSSK